MWPYKPATPYWHPFRMRPRHSMDKYQMHLKWTQRPTERILRAVALGKTHRYHA